MQMGWAQSSDSLILDSGVAAGDSTLMVLDSLEVGAVLDSLPIEPTHTSKPDVRISDQGMEAPCDYGASDSSRLDKLKNIMHLYGEAYVRYQNYDLQAPYIQLDLNTDIATASSSKDSIADQARLAVFTDGTRNFNAGRMRFNFKTKKGIVYDVVTKETDLYVRGGRTKMLDAEHTENGKEVIYNRNALITTCDREHPHYGIRSKKQKVIPDDVVVVGASRLEIAGIPTPLWLPFGFFPITDKSKAGVLIPRDWEYSPSWGYGFRNVGYFTPLSDNANLTATVDFYTRGRFALSGSSQYMKRYGYQGRVNLSYLNDKVEDLETGEYNRASSWGLNWSHSQDAKAHPYRKLSGSINFQSNNYATSRFNTADQVIQNTINSNLNFSYSRPGSLVSFSAGLAHSQNTTSGQFTLDFPSINLNVNRFLPFERKNRIGDAKWYEDLNLNYTFAAKGQLITNDSLLFEPETLNEITSGVQHRSNAAINLKVAKYFNFTPSINYTETWNFNETEGIAEDLDGDGFEEVIEENLWRFNSYRQINASASLGTTLYGTKLFRKGKIRGLQHKMTPSISLTYAPDYLNNIDRFTQEGTLLVDNQRVDTVLISNTLANSTYSSFPDDGKQMTLTYSLNNFLEAKVFSKKDSTDKKVKLLKAFNLSGSYNFAADSFQMRPLGLSANTSLLKNHVSLVYTASFDFYSILDGVRQKELLWSSKKKLARMTSSRLVAITSFSMSEVRGLFQDESDKSTFLAMFDQWRIQHNFTLARSLVTGTDSLQTRVTSHEVKTSGSINLTPNWSVQIRNVGYNFLESEVSYPDFSIVRDLHCWEMSISVQPARNAFQLNIRVKPGTLGFLDLPWSQNRADGGTRQFD